MRFLVIVGCLCQTPSNKKTFHTNGLHFLLVLLALGCHRSDTVAEKKIFSLLSTDEATHVDELVEKTELNSPEVLAALCEMEMKGIVRQVPGKQFVKILL